MKKCPYCETNNFDNAAFCENCGMPLKPGIKISCPQCGKLVREHDKYCKVCGTYLLEDRKCPGCGQTVLLTDAFCSQCGTKLGETPVPAKSEVSVHNGYREEELAEEVFEEDDLEAVAESILNGGETSIEEESIEEEVEENGVLEEGPPETKNSGMPPYSEAENEINNFLIEGGSFMAESKFDDAIKSFSRAIGLVIKNGLDKQEDKRLITLYVRRGEAFKKTGNNERAMDNYSRALKYAQSIFAVSDVERIKNLMSGM